jgi:hypothetical protein
MIDETETPDGAPNSNGEFLRNERGQFKPGTKGGPGSPVARHARETAQRFDEAIFKVCAPDRLVVMLDAVLKRAEAGDVPASEFIRRVCMDRDIPMRLERLEEFAEGKMNQ